MTKLSRVVAVAAVAAACWCVAASSQQIPAQAALDETIRVYCDAWGEPDLERRRQLLERVWSAQGTYTDPVSHVEGRDALSQRITAFLQKFPGARIAPSSQTDLHHGMLRFTWRLVNAEGKTLNEGIDFGELAADGKLAKIVGFFGPVKPL